MSNLRKKRCAAARQSHVCILLKADEDTATAVEVSIATVERGALQFCGAGGLSAALERNAPDRH